MFAQFRLNPGGAWCHLVEIANLVSSNITMSYAFIVVVSVAITVKLIFLSFSLYYTVKSSEAQEKKVRELLSGFVINIVFKEVFGAPWPRLVSMPMSKEYITKKENVQKLKVYVGR